MYYIGLHKCIVGAGMGGLGCTLALLCWPSGVSSTSAPMRLPRPSLRVKPRNGDSFTAEADVLLAADDVKRIIRPGMPKELGVDADFVDAARSGTTPALGR
jgi:hypothetical protein